MVIAMVRVAVLGAGPTGLEAALAAHQRGWDAVVYEQAPHVAGHVRQWSHVRLFTPWSMNVSPRVTEAVGIPPADTCPTGAEYAAHLDRVAALLPDVRLSTTVDQVARDTEARDVLEEFTGVATVAGYTVLHGRGQLPRGIALVDTSDGKRALTTTEDRGLIVAMQEMELVGRPVRVVANVLTAVD